ncbi:MAG: hypothetical protein LHW45_09990 [Candidatus Cloacimonetes bacterium]|nr:hypothetical protein [Candidatus Cloacimonadota bacterium]MDY0367938.1 hypothetical protein [Candidatus Syntrophosphaera sp.]
MATENRGSKTFSRKKSSSGMTVMSPDQTKAWVKKYGRHSRIYAWSFFGLVLPLIFGLIWWELGEINDDALYSFGFAALVLFMLARWSRKQTTQSWFGVVDEMFTKKLGVRRDTDLQDDILYKPMARIRTQSGKVLTQRLSNDLYEYFNPGDRVFKVSGLEFPEKTELDRPERVCLACGNLYGWGEGQCSRCHAPEPDHQTLCRIVGSG